MKMRPQLGNSQEPAANQASASQVSQIVAYAKKLEQENRLLKQGLLPNNSGQNLTSNLKNSLPAHLRPGNVDELTRVIWPFWFPTSRVTVPASGSTRSSFTVSQEAAFIWMSFAKVIHKDIDDITTYIDPRNFNIETGGADGLQFTIRDAQSSRDFHSIPMASDNIGDPQKPTVLPTPMLLLQNSTFEVQWTNDNADTDYYASMIFFGYRVRLDQYQKVMSSVTG